MFGNSCSEHVFVFFQFADDHNVSSIPDRCRGLRLYSRGLPVVKF